MLPLNQYKVKLAEVSNRFVQNPELIVRLLENLGAQNIMINGDEVRSTCPLHDGDNVQAFAVWVDTGRPIWKCHTRCCAKGDLAGLVQKKFNMRFNDAVVYLAAMVGIPITGAHLNITDEQLNEDTDRRIERLLNVRPVQPTIFDEAWVQQSLAGWSHPMAPLAWDFLTGSLNTISETREKRKQFPSEVLRKFEVGFVPEGQWVMPDLKDPTRKIGWFTDRISIPWRNPEGQCIGFAGRRFDGLDYCKYHTFPNTRKGTTFYGLHSQQCQQVIAEREEVVLVEGYGDVWRGWCHGQYNVISPGGTELSRAQIELLLRMRVKSVILFYDSDEAGTLSSRKMAEQVNRRAIKVRIGFPPKDLDPGDLLDPEQYVAGIRQSRFFF